MRVGQPRKQERPFVWVTQSQPLRDLDDVMLKPSEEEDKI